MGAGRRWGEEVADEVLAMRLSIERERDEAGGGHEWGGRRPSP